MLNGTFHTHYTLFLILISTLVGAQTTICVWGSIDDSNYGDIDFDRYNGEYIKQSTLHNGLSYWKQTPGNEFCNPSYHSAKIYASSYEGSKYWQLSEQLTTEWLPREAGCETANLANPTLCTNNWFAFEDSSSTGDALPLSVTASSCPTLDCGRIQITGSGSASCNKIFTRDFSQDYMWTSSSSPRYLYFDFYLFKWYCSDTDGHLYCGTDSYIQHQVWSSQSDGWKDANIGEFFTLQVTTGNWAKFTCLDTLAPTKRPTDDPSPAPTTAPTHSTFSPTPDPTRSPTHTPTRSPSYSPSHSPSNAPTQTPTNAPTNAPSNIPSDSPTKAPSNAPSHTPSISPSSPPTNAPSNAPSLTPSSSPTNTPTDSPIKAPSTPPTNAPSNVPSKTPTNTPTNAPSHAPSLTPTASPTHTPSAPPTSAPSNVPSKAPSNTPTNTPSKTPTNAPSNTPTKAPSTTPTYTPSNAPTNSPVADPTAVTNTPTNTPSNAPSDTPSVAPSAPPTNTPSNAPSDSPSSAPSNAPSNVPSNAPSYSPSIAPSNSPTNAPSNAPIGSPSIAPSASPTKEPTKAPTEPSLHPTHNPTLEPTIATHEPSVMMSTEMDDGFETANTFSGILIAGIVSVSAVLILVVLFVACCCKRHAISHGKETTKLSETGADGTITTIETQMMQYMSNDTDKNKYIEGERESNVIDGNLGKETKLQHVVSNSMDLIALEKEEKKALQHLERIRSAKEEIRDNDAANHGIDKSNDNIVMLARDSDSSSESAGLFGTMPIQQTVGGEMEDDNDMENMNDREEGDLGEELCFEQDNVLVTPCGDNDDNDDNEMGECADCKQYKLGRRDDDEERTFYCEKCWMEYE